jgi:ribosomal protein S27AE
MDSVADLFHFHLKYCERCGGLWLRPDGADTPYCPRCAAFMAALPLSTSRNRRKSESSACALDAIALLACVVGFAFYLISGVFA